MIRTAETIETTAPSKTGKINHKRPVKPPTLARTAAEATTPVPTPKKVVTMFSQELKNWKSADNAPLAKDSCSTNSKMDRMPSPRILLRSIPMRQSMKLRFAKIATARSFGSVRLIP